MPILDKTMGTSQINSNQHLMLHINSNGNSTGLGVHGYDVRYVQNMDDHNFGNIDIYKNEEGKYIMMVKRTFMKD